MPPRNTSLLTSILDSRGTASFLGFVCLTSVGRASESWIFYVTSLSRPLPFVCYRTFSWLTRVSFPTVTPALRSAHVFARLINEGRWHKLRMVKLVGCSFKCWQANVALCLICMMSLIISLFFCRPKTFWCSQIDPCKLASHVWIMTEWKCWDVILVSSPTQSTPCPTGIRDCESSLREGDHPMQTCDLENLHVRSSLLSSSMFRWCFFIFFLNVFMSW